MNIKEETMRKATLATVLGLACFAFALNARANTQYFSAGATCQHADTVGTPLRDVYGFISNTSSTAAMWTVCPTAQLESSTVDVENFKVYYYENNNGSDSDDQFYCAVNMATDTGTTYVSGYRYTCTTDGGCTTADSDDNPGYNYLTFSNPWASTAGIVYQGVACRFCEASPGSCQIRGFQSEVVGS